MEKRSLECLPLKHIDPSGMATKGSYREPEYFIPLEWSEVEAQHLHYYLICYVLLKRTAGARQLASLYVAISLKLLVNKKGTIEAPTTTHTYYFSKNYHQFTIPNSSTEVIFLNKSKKVSRVKHYL